MTTGDGQAGVSSVERINDRVAQCGKIAEHFNKRFARQPWQILERYREGEIELDLVVRIPEGYARAVFKRAGLIEECDLPNVTGTFSADSEPCKNAGEGNKAAMFVLAIEDVEGKEKIIPSLVRLEFFDRGLIEGRKSVDFFVEPFFIQRFGRFDNGEISVRWVNSAVSFGEDHSQAIKAGALRMDDRANTSLDETGDGFSYFKEDIFPPIGLRLSAQTVRLSFEKCPEISLKDINLSVRPLNFDTGIA
jgi:hypothetical protein